MPKQDQLAVATPFQNLPFAECGFTTQETRRILVVGKTKFFEEVLPELESYLEGTRRVVTGRSIIAYRERRLAEPRQSRPTPKKHCEKRRSEVSASK